LPKRYLIPPPADLGSYNADLDAATKVREGEKKDFQLQKTDYEESILKLGRREVS
jgi:hypothetical protein